MTERRLSFSHKRSFLIILLYIEYHSQVYSLNPLNANPTNFVGLALKGLIIRTEILKNLLRKCFTDF